MALIYCRECGKQISDTAPSCPYCGCVYCVKTEQRPADPNLSEKDWLVTLLLCIFLGCLGIHSFYSGKTVIGVVQLLTMGGCGIWALVDFIMLLCGEYKDGEGRVIRNR